MEFLLAATRVEERSPGRRPVLMPFSAAGGREELTTEAQRHREENTEKKLNPVEQERE
jgi:hypothetical protein